MMVAAIVIFFITITLYFYDDKKEKKITKWMLVIDAICKGELLENYFVVLVYWIGY